MQGHRISSHLKKSIGLIRLLFLAALLAACNLPHATPIIPTPSVAPTDTVEPTNPTPTAQQPSLTPNPTATSGQGTITHLLFAPGTTAVVASGNLQPGQSQTFTLEAGKNQAMILLLDSGNHGAYLGVTEPNGNVLLDPSKGWNSWQYMLPATELYTIKVYASTAATSFVLTAKVPAPVTFPAGATTTTVNASTPKGYVISYSVYALAGQAMSVTLSAPANSASLDVFGLAYGELLLGASSLGITWTGKLPSTENYIIEVIPQNGQVVNFSLNIEIH